ncbi:TonB-dependent siderophore receptor [Sphingomonas cannabina]|uniref:TonB-dependent receptor n=1 Tax=Sphingomonas cannabina TaxID=2899123 RepID=UPI001F3488A6|nr:TonB-dependent siderophore receptor [Sphingomonas cannabina]UIJ44202.1 TonB-dependent siderophore receptor [Sphingomonas cannabina]
MAKHRTGRTAGRAFSCALVLASVPAYAADASSEGADTPQQQDIVVTGTLDKQGYVPTSTGAAKVPIALKDLPQSVSVVPAAVLQDQRALSLQDALKNVPGVGFSHGDGQRDQVTIRGFTAIADQFVDGFRDDGLYFRDLSNVERIEVVKGPAAVLYGRGSSGGLINRVTKKPDVDIASAAVSAGSFDTYRGELDIGQFDERSGVGFRLTGAYEDDDSFRSQQFLKRVALAPSLVLGQGKDTTLLVQADYLLDRRLTDFGIPAINGRPVDVPRSTYYGAANARDADVSRSEVLSQSITLVHRFSDSLSFRNGFRHYRFTLDRHNTNATGVNAAAGTVTLSHGGIARDEDGWSNQSELTQKLDLAGTHHTLLYGFEIARQVKDAKTLQSRVVAVTDILDPVLPTVNNAAFTQLSASTLSTFDTRGLYVQDLIDFGHGIKAMLGLRHDWFIQKTDQRLPGQPDLERTDRKFSPRAGLIFQPDDNQSYYASWSRSFQPSAETFALAANNADIAPEQTTNKEVGAKYSLLDQHLSIQVAGFVLRRTGIKGTDPATNTIVPIGTQRTRGVELSAALDLPSGLRVIAGYSYLDTRVTASATPTFIGKRATITPRNQANLFVTKTILKDYGVGAGANYVGDRWADPQNTTVLPHYFTADAMAWANLGPARFQINAYNLFDKHYIVSGHGTSALLNLPGAPRTILGTVRFAM